MLQVPVEEWEIAPGRAVEWTVSFAGATGPTTATGPTGHTGPTRATVPSAPPGPPGSSASVGPVASYNQEDHFSVAQGLRRADVRYRSWIGGSFEIEGPLDVRALEEAFLHLVRRHEVLRCVFREHGGALALDVVGPRDVKLERVEAGRIASRAEAGAYVRRFLGGTDTLRGPWLVMGAMVRDDSTTVYFACDHLVIDGVSVPVAVHDIATAYAALREGRRILLPEASGFLGYAEQERRRGRALAADDGRLGHWRRFTAGAGGVFPPFPLDLGMAPGGVYQAVNESDTLLTATAADAVEARCRAVGARMSVGVLAAVGLALHGQGGPDVYRGLLPVSTRDRGPDAQSMGWFVNTVPVEFPVTRGRGFEQVVTAARDALAAARGSTGTPFVRAFDLLTSQQCGPQVWPQAVNFFSYLDYRVTPGARGHLGWQARAYVWASHSNGIFFWFHRNDTGVHLSTIHVDTPQARRTKAGFVRALTRTLDDAAHHVAP
ncbi:condensation domain-containing protein [Kitasatospora sp. NBC_01287]|uniref:condensation domain-containing protein n=1 Tax=Kitasatospora sp. NBC_01287 TaxID=2903573 RepID=UPI0022597EE6|nr:condensation domain-containing protein [Kitasatospora sp. NBC_01287]MCX4751329.1 condensation domain-containing protein [Kitasatospora sp. NBC_01287]